MQPGEKILGVDGGGTKTAWVLVEREPTQLRLVEQGKLPPSNLRLTPTDTLRAIFRQMPVAVERVGVFLAGCATPEDRTQLAAICREIWPSAKITVGSDRDSGLAAGLGHGDGVVVNAGTGSSVTGRRGDKIEKAGGWGHILGDVGGGYFIARNAIRLMLREYDLHRGELEFAANILRALALNDFDELVRWAQTADKMQVAMLTPIVFESAANGNAPLLEIIEESAQALCEYTEAVAGRLHLLAPKVMLLGGLLQHDSIYAHTFRRRLKKNLPDARVAAAAQLPDFGAAWLAAEIQEPPILFATEASEQDAELARAATEEPNERSADLANLPPREFVELFVNEECFVQEALRARADELARAIEMVTAHLREGGRLFYIGAGTSGRLGVLDASEIPPTFGAAPESVQGIIAGGVTALHRSVEGAEDEAGDGAIAVESRGLRQGDVACGITASGRAPFVLAALARAAALGASTILLTCNPNRSPESHFDLEINLPTGPELLAGSTRLKAGTATKVALNIISTGTMVALGKVQGNLMIDLVASNQKLRERAARLVTQVTKCSYEEAVRRLDLAHWNLRAALSSAK
jgi:N-acetylmuramic acid 6-phosphate etherase